MQRTDGGDAGTDRDRQILIRSIHLSYLVAAAGYDVSNC